MARFLISATVYATYEYGNIAEIEAETAEDAAWQFEEIARQRGNPLLDLSEPVDKAFNIEGTYKVIAVPEGRSVDDVIDDEPAIEGQGFSGPQ